MSELIQMVQELKADNAVLKQMVKDLTILVMKDKVDTTWVKEDLAAEMLGYKPRTLRKAVKDGSINIAVTNTNGRNWQYNRKGILQYKQSRSSLQ